MSRCDLSSSMIAGRGLPRAWRHWGLSLLVVLGLMLLFGMGHRLLEQRSDDTLYRVIVNGQPLTLDTETHAALGRDMQEMTGDIEARLLARMRPWIRMRLAVAFAPLEAAVPDYLDWYFSLSGSYTRLGVTMVGDVEAWLEVQLHERLVETSGIETALAEVQMAYPQQMASMQHRLVDQLAQRLYERYAPRQVTMQEVARPTVRVLDLDEVLNRSLGEGLDMTRWSTAAAGGVGLGLLTGRTLARRLGAAVAMQGGRMAMRSLLTRLGVVTARSLASGGMVAAATVPSGPGALMAGAATTAVTLAGFAGSEYALLEVQEARHRPAMQSQLLDAIGQTRQAMQASLEAAAADGAATLTGQLEAQTARPKGDEPMPSVYRILGRRGE